MKNGGFKETRQNLQILIVVMTKPSPAVCLATPEAIEKIEYIWTIR